MQAIRRVVGQPVKVRAFPWWLVTLASPFSPLFAGLREMRYLWRTQVRMGNARLTAVLGCEPHTPIDAAVRATLIGLGCLPKAPQLHPECSPHEPSSKTGALNESGY